MTHASVADEPEPYIRNPEFKRWSDSAVKKIQRDEGLTIEQIAKRGNISRAQLNRWRGKGGPQSLPEPANLIMFCVRNGLGIAEPFGILGWEDAPIMAASVDERVREAIEAVVEVLADDRISEDDLNGVVQQLGFLAERLRARTRRGRDSSG